MQHLARTVAFAVALAVGACLQDDPQHCANRGGDAACQDAGIGAYCSLCVEKNWGCRAEPDPDPSCRMDADELVEADTDEVGTDALHGGPRP